MIKELDLTKFDTGLKLEAEFNRIIQLALAFKLSHVEAGDILAEICDHGVKSGEFPKADYKYYMDRKNTYGNRERTHLEMARNIRDSQKREHTAFLYFYKWFKNKYPNEATSWIYHGSDQKGYIMIVNSQLREVIKPDYKITRNGKTILIEAKTFGNTPTFKVANIRKYRSYGEKGCYLVFRYNEKHYISGFNGMGHFLELPFKNNWKQTTVVLSNANINSFLEKQYMKEIIC